MKRSPNSSICLQALCALLPAFFSLTEALATEDALLQDGGFLEIAVGVVAAREIDERFDPSENDRTQTTLGVLFGGAWRRGPLFAEVRIGGFGGINVGTTLWHNDKWVLDFVALHETERLNFLLDFDDDDEEEAEASQDTESRRNLDLLDRSDFYGGSGFRLTGYHGPVLTQTRLISDWDKGLVGSIHLGRQWQFGNWNWHALAGIRHLDADFTDTVWGVDQEEATTRFPAFNPGALSALDVEVGVNYPLSTHWVFRSEARLSRWDQDITDSPLVSENLDTFVHSSLIYSF